MILPEKYQSLRKLPENINYLLKTFDKHAGGIYFVKRFTAINTIKMFAQP